MLKEKLQKQIEQEAEKLYPLIGDVKKRIGYIKAAGLYAEKLQSAEEKAARYEKALIKIVSLSCKVDSRDAILELKSIASMAVAKGQEALTPKTSEDEG